MKDDCSIGEKQKKGPIYENRCIPSIHFWGKGRKGSGPFNRKGILKRLRSEQDQQKIKGSVACQRTS